MKKKQLETKRLELQKQFDNLLKKELTEDAQSMLELIKTALEDLFKAIEEGAETVTEAQVENIETAIEELKSKYENSNRPRKTLAQFLESKKELLQEMKKKKSREGFMMKAADVITTAGNISPQPNAYMPSAEVRPNINPIVTPSQRILDYVSVGSVSSPRVVLINETAGEGDAEFIAEGVLKPLADFKFETEDAVVKKIAVAVKVSDEMFDDIPYMATQTEKLIFDKLQRKLRSKVLNGTGVGDEIKGVGEYAGGYAQTCLNGKIQSPGLPEVLKVASSQIKSLGFDGPQVAFVNTCDWTESSLRKDANGNLLDYSEILKEIEVVETGEISPDEFLIGDLSKYEFLVYSDYTLEYGYENDDFRKNLITIIAEMRVVGVMSDNNIGSLVKDTVSNVVSLIEKP